MTSERDIEQRLVQEVKKLGGECLKFVSPGVRGVPDRIVLLPGGHIVFVELKAKNGVLSKQQQAVLSRFNQLGIAWAVVSTQQTLDLFLRGCRHNAEEAEEF